MGIRRVGWRFCRLATGGGYVLSLPGGRERAGRRSLWPAGGGRRAVCLSGVEVVLHGLTPMYAGERDVDVVLLGDDSEATS